VMHELAALQVTSVQLPYVRPGRGGSMGP
jgi:hypothetical protein